jgi:hypothetical protein
MLVQIRKMHLLVNSKNCSRLVTFIDLIFYYESRLENESQMGEWRLKVIHGSMKKCERSEQNFYRRV